jgi:hypothetical protein
MANFPKNKKYNKFWRGSTFNESIFDESDISRLENNKNFVNQKQTDILYPSSQSFAELNEIAIKSTTNFYIVDDFVDEYFDDVDEFFETYNTGSFTGDFEGTVSVSDILTIKPSRELPSSPTPGSFVTLQSQKSKTLSLYFYNGEQWITVIE